MMLRQLEVLPGLISGGHNLNNMRGPSIDSRHRKETARTPTESSEEK